MLYNPKYFNDIASFRESYARIVCIDLFDNGNIEADGSSLLLTLEQVAAVKKRVCEEDKLGAVIIRNTAATRNSIVVNCDRRTCLAGKEYLCISDGEWRIFPCFTPPEKEIIIGEVICKINASERQIVQSSNSLGNPGNQGQ